MDFHFMAQYITPNIGNLEQVGDAGPVAVLGLVLLLVVAGGLVVIRNNTSVNRELIKLLSDQNSTTSKLDKAIDRNSDTIDIMAASMAKLADAQTAQTNSQYEYRSQEHSERQELANVISKVSEAVLRHDDHARGFIQQQTEVTGKMLNGNLEVMQTLTKIIGEIVSLKTAVGELKEQAHADTAGLTALITRLEKVVDELKTAREDADTSGE